MRSAFRVEHSRFQVEFKSIDMFVIAVKDFQVVSGPSQCGPVTYEMGSSTEHLNVLKFGLRFLGTNSPR